MNKLYLLFLAVPLFSITLEDVTSYALKHSTIINKAKNETILSQLNKKESQRKQFGELNLMGDYNHYNIERTLAPLPPSAMMSGKPITTSKDIYSLGVAYSIPLFTGFAETRDIEINKLASKMAKAKIKLTKEQLVFNIRSLYLAILTQKHILKAQNSYIYALEKLKKDIAYQVELGKKAEVDLIKVDADLEEAKATKEMLISNIEVTKATLSSLANKKIKRVSDIKFKVKKTHYSIDELYSKIQNLQKTKIEELSIKKAQKLIDKSRSAQFPQLNLNAYYGKNYANDIKSDDWDNEELSQVGVSLRYNIIDFGKRSINTQKAKIAKLQAKLHKQQTMLDIKKQLTEAVSKIKQSYAQYKSNYARYRLSKKAKEIEKARYESSVSTINDLLLAQAKELLAKAKVIESKYDYQKSRYYLDYVMERGVKSGQ
jgi:outer membrane protein TolC